MKITPEGGRKQHERDGRKPRPEIQVKISYTGRPIEAERRDQHQHLKMVDCESEIDRKYRLALRHRAESAATYKLNSLNHEVEKENHNRHQNEEKNYIDHEIRALRTLELRVTSIALLTLRAQNSLVMRLTAPLILEIIFLGS